MDSVADKARPVSYLVLGSLVAIGGFGCWHALPVRADSDRPVSDRPSTVVSATWDPTAAAAYLDRREVWWQGWPHARKDSGTICISCHTVVPYAMARQTLRADLHESGLSAPEKVMLGSVEKRVSHWPEMVPFYSDEANGTGKTAEAHATEAVLNAVILASYDARQGQLRAITQKALDNAWALQEPAGENAGGWKWQDFHLAPWESAESSYQGAALLMVALGNAPGNYAAGKEVRDHIESLQKYLRRKYAAQPLLNRLYVLWASAKAPRLLSDAEREQLIGEVNNLQQADGGWRLSALDVRKRIDNSAQPTESDGYATALVVLVLEQSGLRPQGDTLTRGVAWLEQHQDKDGEWHTASLNKQRDPTTDIGRFMSDAATGYAVLALENRR